MFKYALNLVLRRPLRTLLTSMGVTIAVFLISFIVFGMQDLQGLILGEFNDRFSPTMINITTGDMLSMFGGDMTATYDEEKVEPKPMTQDVVNDLSDQRGVIDISEMLFLSSLEISLDEKEVSFPGGTVAGWNVKSDNTYFADFWGDDEGVMDVKDGTVWVSTSVVNYYKETEESIIGKTITLKPSQASIFTSGSKSMLGKEYNFEISAVFDPGQDKNDCVLSINDGKRLAADLGGFDSGDEYVESVGYTALMANVDTDYHDEFKSYIEDEYGYQGISAEDIISILGSVTTGLTIALIMFGLVSAAVAGIGIVNTMIMSIYEQTKEIGVIKAIGASNKQVLGIFLIQSGFIGLLGGVVGLGSIFVIMLGLDGIVVKQLVDAGFGITQFFHFDWLIAGGITVASIVVGIVAGIYPAVRAAKLDPIKALRYE